MSRPAYFYVWSHKAGLLPHQLCFPLPTFCFMYMCFAVRGRPHRMHPSGVAAHYQVVLLHALSTEEDQWGFLVCFFGLLLFCSVILLSCVDKGMLTDYIRCSHADRSYVTCTHTCFHEYVGICLCGTSNRTLTEAKLKG